LWVGRDTVPLIIAFVMALPIAWSNVREGLLETDKQLLEVARVFSFSARKRLFALHLPSLLPYFVAACRSAIGIAWKAGIAAEVLCAPKDSIGRAIYEGKQYLLTNELFAWTLTVILISVVTERATLWLLSIKRKGGTEA
jgi:NitT/TauT family transport system permease protein